MMDTSIEYIKMCEKAEEIQELWEADEGDYCTGSSFGEKANDVSVLKNSWYCGSSTLFMEDFGGDIIPFYDYKDNIVWLPRQDQLQKILLSIDSDFWYLSSIFQEWVDSEFINLYYKNNFTSFEQLWLAFVMKKNIIRFGMGMIG